MKMPKLPAADPDKPQSKWDKITVATPVVLTVVATILAGLSSSEMNQGQYHRALAAQNQSKAGDQWNLFQAKRMRQSGVDNTLSILESMSGGGEGVLDLATWQSGFARLPEEMKEAQAIADRTRAAIERAKAGAGAAADLAVNRFTKTAAAEVAKAEAINKELLAALDEKEVVASLGTMSAGRLPEIPSTPVGNDRIRNLAKAIEDHKSEADTQADVLKVTKADLDEAFATVRANEAASDAALRPINSASDRLNKLLARRVALGKTFERALRDLATVASASAGDGAAALSELTSAAAQLTGLADREKSLSSELFNDLTAARLRFNGRRYEHEARFNLLPAHLYEIQVRQSSAMSDRHRVRSTRFFYGMLCAQAGVTIATLAMAVRQRSVMWGLASIAGLSAILFAGYVYLYS